MDKEKIDIENRFNDLSECSEYYYDELGKLNAVRPGAGDLTRKEGKKLKNKIMYFLFSSIDNLQAKAKANDKVDKAEIKDFNKEFKKERANQKTTVLNWPRKLINLLTRGRRGNQIEIESPDDQLQLPPEAPSEDAGQDDYLSSPARRPSTSVEVVAEQAEQDEEEEQIEE